LFLSPRELPRFTPFSKDHFHQQLNATRAGRKKRSEIERTYENVLQYPFRVITSVRPCRQLCQNVWQRYLCTFPSRPSTPNFPPLLPQIFFAKRLLWVEHLHSFGASSSSRCVWICHYSFGPRIFPQQCWRVVVSIHPLTHPLARHTIAPPYNHLTLPTCGWCWFPFLGLTPLGPTDGSDSWTFIHSFIHLFARRLIHSARTQLKIHPKPSRGRGKIKQGTRRPGTIKKNARRQSQKIEEPTKFLWQFGQQREKCLEMLAWWVYWIQLL